MPDLLTILNLAGQALVVSGAMLAAILGAVGVLRFPDIYTRLHAASITDTGGATLILLGLGMQSPDMLIALKLLIAWLFLMLTGPVASHALADAAHSSGLWPWIGGYTIERSGLPQKEGKP